MEGLDVSFDELLARLEIGATGVEVRQLCKVATDLGATADPIEFGSRTAASMRLPAILVVSEKHAVCAVDRDGSKIRIIDSALNRDDWIEVQDLAQKPIQLAISIRRNWSVETALQRCGVSILAIATGILIGQAFEWGAFRLIRQPQGIG